MRERDDLARLENCGHIWLGFIDLTYEYKRTTLKTTKQTKKLENLDMSQNVRIFIVIKYTAGKSVTFLSNLTLSCQALLRRGVYEN